MFNSIKKLMFVMVLSGLVIVFAVNASAQSKKLCTPVSTKENVSKDLIVVNKTGVTVILYYIAPNCEELETILRVSPGASETYNGVYDRQVFRLREEGTKAFVKDIVISGEALQITVAVQSSNAGNTVSTIADEIRKKMIGTWLQPENKTVVDENEFTVTEKGKILIKTSYSLNDNMLEFTGTDGNTSRRKVSFKNNNKTMVWENIAKGTSAEFTRVLKTAKLVRKTKK